MQNRLYAIGGYNGQERLNTVEVFDAVTKRWSKVIKYYWRVVDISWKKSRWQR